MAVSCRNKATPRKLKTAQDQEGHSRELARPKTKGGPESDPLAVALTQAEVGNANYVREGGITSQGK